MIFSCPHCGKKLRVKDEAAGKTGKCTGCGTKVTVPSPSTPLTQEAGELTAEQSGNAEDRRADNEVSDARPAERAETHPAVPEKKARMASPFDVFRKTAKTCAPEDWAQYTSEEYGFSFQHPSDWSVHLENTPFQSIPLPWIGAVILVSGTPPDSYVAFHVNIREVNVLESYISRNDGSPIQLSCYEDIPRMQREEVLTSFHSPTLLDERTVSIDGLEGFVQSFRHFGLKAATDPVGVPLVEHSWLVCGERVTYNIVIEHSEPLAKKLMPDLRAMLSSMRLTMEALLHALTDRGYNHRSGILKALQSKADVRAVPALIEVLADRDLLSRYIAAKILGRLRDSRAVDPLIESLMDHETAVSAADALGQIADPRAVQPLLNAFNSGEAIVRAPAADALEKITGKRPEVAKGSSGGEGGCFVATAAMGDYEHPHVLELRRFRDAYLRRRWWGRRFIATYGRLSPPLARIIAPYSVLRRLSRILIVLPVLFVSRHLERNQRGKKCSNAVDRTD